MINEIDEKERLNTLKTRADMIGLTYSPNIKAETLAAKIESFIGSSDTGVTINTNEDNEDNSSEVPTEIIQNRAQRIAKLNKDASKLVRVIVTCNDPSKTQWTGEYITVGNGVIPIQKKFIPYGVEWHVPTIMLNMLREMNYSKSTKIKHADGSFERKVRQHPKYNIQVLPPITAEEFDNIKHRQLATKSMDNN